MVFRALTSNRRDVRTRRTADARLYWLICTLDHLQMPMIHG